MSETTDGGWVKAATNELNNLLQIIVESAQFLDRACAGKVDGAGRYIELIRSSVDRAVEVTRRMSDRAVEVGAGSGAPGAPGAPSAGQGENRPPVEVINPGGARELILVVDDEDFVTLLAQRVLVEEGYKVATAKDGFRALDIFRRIHGDIGLVILDFVMPVLDGEAVFAEMQSIDARVPVVLSSGFTEPAKVREMLARGLRGFIPKPYTRQKLLQQVRAALDAARRPA